ncbi:MAG: ASCH domain-containing protein [Euryarchaeota archaeon]|nr:ASCH domain-containing protein [Euryarchaeota archaeon]
MTQSRVDRYWKQFQRSLPPTARRQEKYDWVFHFGSKRTARAIAALVLEGTKTATGSLKWVYQAENKPIPKPGDLSVITDGSKHPVCVIEDTEIRVVPFDKVDARFAFDCGEGDRTLEGWRKGYWQYIETECARIGRRPTRKTPLVCERFRVVYKEPVR